MALEFDGIDQYVDVGTLGNFGSEMATNKPCIAMHVKTSFTIGSQVYFGTGAAGNNTSLWGGFNYDYVNEKVLANVIHFYLKDEDGNALNGNTGAVGVCDGNWHTAILNFDGPNDTVAVYLDAVSKAVNYANQETPDNFANFPNNMLLGAHNWGGVAASLFDGELIVRLYNRHLTLAEIQAFHYARGNDNIVNGLVGYWRMNEKPDGGTATVASSVIDVSGNGNHGSPANSPVYRAGPVKLVRPVTMVRIVPHWTETLEEKLAFSESLTKLERGEVLTESLALLENLPSLDRGLVLEESLALKEDETVAINALLTESLGLLESLPTLERALTLEESLGLLETVTDMLLDAAAFEARLSLQMVRAGIWFRHKDVDYTNYLNDVSTITRSAELTSGFGSAILSNIEQIWNLFLSDRTEIGTIAQLGIKLPDDLGFTNEKELFTGRVEDVSYTEAEAILKIRDKMVSTLEKRLGNGENPVEYLTPQNPADMAWDLLTTHGGLDNTASTANTDIDYTSWSSYKTDCTTLKYSLRAKFTGHYITTALLLIADLTSSYIWIGEDGKFKFKRPIPPFIPGTLPSYNRSNCLAIDASVTKENLINSFRCRYGWDEDINEWAGSHLAEDEASKTEFGTYPGVEEDKVVWHADLDSATEHAERVVDKNKQPLIKVTVTSTLKGIFLSLGDTILVTELLKNLNPIYARVEEIQNVDIAQGLVDFICRDISDEKILAFVLDDAYLGLLDQDYNPMMGGD